MHATFQLFAISRLQYVKRVYFGQVMWSHYLLDSIDETKGVFLRKLYLILARELNRVKIGISKNPENRLKQLQTASPTPLELFAFTNSSDAFVEERELHNLFSGKNITGEWFELTPIDYINLLKDWNYDPGIHYNIRNQEELKIGEEAFISWDSKSLCSVRIIDITDQSVEVEILSKIGGRVGNIGWTHQLYKDEVRKHPIDALINRVTL